MIRTLALAAGLAIAATSFAVAQSTTADGVFTADQATAGAEVFDMNCATCHAGNLRGTPGGPGLIGVRFELNWADKSVGELYTYIHDFMPAGQPGTLTDEQYAQVTAYILEQNGYPAGETELGVDAEALNEITIVEME